MLFAWNKGFFMKFKKKWPLLFLILLIAFFFIEWAFAPGGFKKVYYNAFYEPNEVQVAVDPNFHFFKKGYTADLKLDSKYYVSHRILLFIKSKNVPVDYHFSGQIKIEFFIKDELLESFLVESPANIWRREEYDYYGNYLVYGTTQKRFAKSTRAFELAEIPFNLFCLKWSRLKNMRIRVTVIKPDEGLQEFCESATLVIIPDLGT